MPYNRNLDLPDTKNPLFVSSIAKGFKVLNAFCLAGHPLTFTELCSITKLDKSAIQRFCYTFVELGFISKDANTKCFTPTPQMLDLGFAYLSMDPIVQIANPYLVDAREQAGETVNLARRMGTDVMYISRLPAKHSPLANPLPGGRSPLFCTAAGRAILSRLDDDMVEQIIDQSTLTPLTTKTNTDKNKILELVAQAAEDGFAVAQEECILNEITIAAPIIGVNGRVEGSINIATSIRKFSPEAMRLELAPIITQTAMNISRAMGFRI